MEFGDLLGYLLGYLCPNYCDGNDGKIEIKKISDATTEK